MDITINKQSLNLNTKSIKSKSCLIRLLFLSHIYGKSSTTIDVSENDCLAGDVQETIKLLSNYSDISFEKNKLTIKRKEDVKIKELMVSKSATLFRFASIIIPFLTNKETTIRCSKELFLRLGNEFDGVVEYKLNNDRIDVRKILDKKEYHLNTSITSQVASALIMILPLLGHNTKVYLSSESSMPYIDLTIRLMSEFGINVKRDDKTIFVMHNQITKEPTILSVDSDPSFSLFVSVMNHLGVSITEDSYQPSSLDPDFFWLNKLKQANFDLDEEIDLEHTPDSIAILVPFSVSLSHKVVFKNICRLSKKESNRPKVLFDMIKNLGGNVELDENNLAVFPSNIHGGVVDTKKDHRLVYSALILSALTKEDVTIKNIQGLSKTNPNLLNELLKHKNEK